MCVRSPTGPLSSRLLTTIPEVPYDDGDDGYNDKDLKPGKKAYEVNFKVYSPSDIQAMQDTQIAEVSAILDQPPENTAILLRHARWNKEKLIENYMEKEGDVLEKAGLGKKSTQQIQLRKIPGFVCDICCEDSPNLTSYALRCEHRYCTDCYRQYLSQKVKDEGEAARIRCPGDGCNRIVDSKTLDLLVADDLKSRYETTPNALGSQTLSLTEYLDITSS